MIDPRILLPLEEHEVQAVLDALEDRRDYLQQQARDCELVNWQVSADGFRKSALDVRVLIARVHSLMKGEGQ